MLCVRVHRHLEQTVNPRVCVHQLSFKIIFSLFPTALILSKIRFVCNFSQLAELAIISLWQIRSPQNIRLLLSFHIGKVRSFGSESNRTLSGLFTSDFCPRGHTLWSGVEIMPMGTKSMLIRT